MITIITKNLNFGIPPKIGPQCPKKIYKSKSGKAQHLRLLN